MGYYITNESGGFESPQSERLKYEGQETQKPIEIGPKVAELHDFLESKTAQTILASLAINGIEGNPELTHFAEAQETLIDAIGDPIKSNQQKILLELKKALLIGIAGDIEYAHAVISAIGKVAQSHISDSDIEDYASAALEILNS